MTARRWVFTLNNPGDFVFKPEDCGVRVAVWQLEQGEQGTPHLQGYVVFKKPCRLAGVSKIIPRAHWEPAKGNNEQCVAYCTKEETRQDGPWFYPDEATARQAGPGQRSDLLGIKRKLDQGIPEFEIAFDDECFSAWVRHHKAFTRYETLRAPKRTEKSQVYLVIGEPGCGKSHWIREISLDAYWKQPGKWWDNYNGTADVVLDDFRGCSLQYTTLLHIMDKYPLQVESKGGNVNFNPRRIFISSNFDPGTWYDQTKEQIRVDAILRRIDFRVTFPENFVAEINPCH